MFSRRLCCHAEIWVSLVHRCPATEWPFLHAAKKQRQNWSYKGPRLGWKSKKVLYVSTRGQLDIFQVFPYDFFTFLAVVWPGLLGTSCIACFRKVMYPQNQQHYCRSQGKMNKLDSCKKKKKYRQSIDQAWGSLSTGPFVTSQVLCLWSPPCPSWLQVFLMVNI